MPEAQESSAVRCILFADLAGSTRLYEKLGDTEARHAVERCLKRVSVAVDGCQGRVVKTIGDAVMAEFSEAHLALLAACQMQQRVADLPPVGGMALAIRVGFHCGPVIAEGDDVFGDTVNLAARLADLAKAGQILASGTCIDSLPALARQGTRELEPLTVKGKAEPVRICEVIWHDEGDLTLMAPTVTTEVAQASLRLLHAGRAVAIAGDWDVVVLGRDKTCGVVIGDRMASRQHARIERRGDRIVLIDQSTNGTWVTPEGAEERPLRREELQLAGTGRIAFGHPYAADGESLEYRVE